MIAARLRPGFNGFPRIEWASPTAKAGVASWVLAPMHVFPHMSKRH
jgi:hypothetical protein